MKSQAQRQAYLIQEQSHCCPLCYFISQRRIIKLPRLCLIYCFSLLVLFASLLGVYKDASYFLSHSSLCISTKASSESSHFAPGLLLSEFSQESDITSAARHNKSQFPAIMNTDSEAGAAEYTGALWLNIKFVPSDSDLSDRDLLDKIITSIQSRQLTISCHSLAAYASLFFSIKINGPFHGVDDIYKEASSNV